MLSIVPIRDIPRIFPFNSGNLAIDSPVRISTTMEGDGTNLGSRPEIALTANVHPSVSDLFCSLTGLSNSGGAFHSKPRKIHDLDLRKNPRPNPQNSRPIPV